MKSADGYMRYYDRIEPMRNLSNEEYGAVTRAVDDYAQFGVLPELPAELEPFFLFAKPSIDAGKIKYAEACAKNTYNIAVKRYKKDDPNKPEFWQWYAAFDGYNPNLFKKESWYDLCTAEHERIRAYTNATITNTNPTQSNQNHEPDPERDTERGEGGDGNLTDEETKAYLTNVIMQECGDSKAVEKYFSGQTWKNYLQNHLEPEMGLQEHAKRSAFIYKQTGYM